MFDNSNQCGTQEMPVWVEIEVVQTSLLHPSIHSSIHPSLNLTHSSQPMKQSIQSSNHPSHPNNKISKSINPSQHSISPSIHTSIHQSTPTINQSLHPAQHRPKINQSIHPFIRPSQNSVNQSMHPSVHPSIHPPTHRSTNRHYIILVYTRQTVTVCPARPLSIHLPTTMPLFWQSHVYTHIHPSYSKWEKLHDIVENRHLHYIASVSHADSGQTSHKFETRAALY